MYQYISIKTMEKDLNFGAFLCIMNVYVHSLYTMSQNKTLILLLWTMITLI